MNKYIIYFIFLVFLSSCSTMSRLNSAATEDIDKRGIVQSPMMLDMDVSDTRVTGVAQAKTKEDAKQNAVANALEGTGADLLIDPNYSITSSTGRVTASVSGFPATYKNIRQYKPLTNNSVDEVEGNESSDANVKSTKKKGKPIGKTGKTFMGVFLSAIVLTSIIVLIAL